jgi:hypothetical protein
VGALDALGDADALGLAHERIGRRVASIVAEYARSLERRSLVSGSTPSELTSMFAEELPATGCSEDDLLDDFERRIVPHAMHIPSPRYFGLFNPTPLPIAVWADALSSTLNQNVSAWRQSPSATAVEACVIRWLCELVGYARPGDFGTLTSGGSEANLVALKCARDAVPGDVSRDGVASAPGRLVVYASEQVHYSIRKAADILGLGRAGLRLLPTDSSRAPAGARGLHPGRSWQPVLEEADAELEAAGRELGRAARRGAQTPGVARPQHLERVGVKDQLVAHLHDQRRVRAAQRHPSAVERLVHPRRRRDGVEVVRQRG